MSLALKAFVPLTFAAALAVVTACDNGPSAVASSSGDAPASAQAPVASTSSGDRGSRTEAAVPTVDGKPIWSSNSRYTAQENARRAFERNGADFGARDLDDFVKKAHAFADHPPEGAASLTRANGDRLLYDVRSNVFMVVTREGAPRTMFKPDDGPAYWEEQKSRESGRRNAASRGSDDNG